MLEVKLSEKVLTVRELALFLRISKASAYALIREGKIEGIRVGRSIRIPSNNLDRFLESDRLVKTPL